MNKIEYIKENFKNFYVDQGAENGILQGTKYAGCATHCRACVNTLVRMIKPKSILEIGSYHYESTIAMSNAMDTYMNTNEGIIHTFDIKKGGYDGNGDSSNLPQRIRAGFWYPYHTTYDEWKYTDDGIVLKDFRNYSNEQLFEMNSNILKQLAPENGYDLIFIDGDHSYEGIKKDWEHIKHVSNNETLVVIDNVWDIRLQEVRNFYNDLKTNKWDFLSSGMIKIAQWYKIPQYLCYISMKIKLYIVTYDNDAEVNKTLTTLLHSGIKSYDYEIKIINNKWDKHVILDNNFDLDLSVINNNTRPSFSTGHLARNWNECLIDGFKSVNDPDADIVILSQNDVSYNNNCINELIELHKKYNFVQNGCGDAMHSYTIDAIKNIGLWDERFCNIGYQECDYFLRCKLYNDKYSTITDSQHNRFHNPTNVELVNPNRIYGHARNDNHHIKSVRFHNISRQFFISKWSGEHVQIQNINELTCNHPQTILYPYFETDIPNLNNKGYLIF